ncbi:MAG: hypothetical protein H0W63_04870 [Gemmatimonadaceae bacterium]|nr:hypothetical protein [Gemmatimonadaceae bacterium]
MKSRLLFIGAATALVSGACNSAAGPASDPGITADVNEIASSFDALALLSLADAGASVFAPTFSISALGGLTPQATVAAVNRSISVTRPCPAGGTVAIVGSSTGTSDPIAHNLTLTSSLTRTEAACAINTQHGVVIVNGNPSVAMTNAINIVAGKPVGLQTQTQKGSFTWTRGTQSGTCNVDVTSTFDPTAGTISVSGTMCGRSVSVTRTAPKLP